MRRSPPVKRRKMPRMAKYWLVKSEPGVFSIDDLGRARNQTTFWDGVRNFQARNLLRDMAVGDGVIFYHSSADPPAAARPAKVAAAARPAPTQFDAKSDHHAPDSSRDDPRWYGVDIQLDRKFTRPVTLAELRANPALEGMVLLKRGSRLSVQPVTPAEWKVICKLGFAP